MSLLLETSLFEYRLIGMRESIGWLPFGKRIIFTVTLKFSIPFYYYIRIYYFEIIIFMASMRIITILRGNKYYPFLSGSA